MKDCKTSINQHRLRVKKLLKEKNADGCLIYSSVNKYYLSGLIFKGFIYIHKYRDPVFFVQRETSLEETHVFQIKKPEEIPAILESLNYPDINFLFMEKGQMPYNDCVRLKNIFKPEKTGDATELLRIARMIKTEWEIEQFRISAAKHAEVYDMIPSVFHKGMRDIDFQIEIERLMRQNGSIGLFRTHGDMEIFMGSLLTGNNASTPSPYNFALGGAGIHNSLPIGSNGEIIDSTKTVMVDFAGNFTAYMTDMTRVYTTGEPGDEAGKAHKLSVEMHKRLMSEVKPGVSCSSVWRWSKKMAEEAGFGENFMGRKFKAKFVGHGTGLEINEPPILMERSGDVFQPGMVFAYEPKFVFDGVGAAGIENTYIVTESGVEKLTVFEEDIIKIP
ncbi:MAG: Xaa-Pro peptidase family protein [Dysgonamonadaceae bacterium]|jgi:Xaa-Pro aminopeptidase|nr:Xaa-Pro peptidase family protein [Dysgonamonadaceae bacterium]